MKGEKQNPLSIPGLYGGPQADAAPTELGTRVTAFDRWLARALMRIVGSPRIALDLWDDEPAYEPEGTPAARVVVRDRRTLLAMVVSPEIGFGDGYSSGSVEIRGELATFLDAAYRGLHRAAGAGPLNRTALAWLHRPRGNSLLEARRNIHHHYDLGNAFYRLWLDREMVYTCAYYSRPEMTLEQAQHAKLEHVCRKLELRPGQRVVEAGCGWGALALYMARHHGVTVRAYNISPEQIRFARERAQAEGLADRVEFVESDYRNIEGRYDAFVSVGMLEHIGPARYHELGSVLARCLEPDGRGLVHSIGRNRPSPNNAWIERRIFPGSCPPSLGQMMALFEPWGLSVLDVENLRQHYARTCSDWLTRFDAVSAEVASTFDEYFVRAWRLYLAGSVAAFSTGSLQLFQVVFAPSTSNTVPWTREHIYRCGSPGG